jgi:alpha-mannosidase
VVQKADEGRTKDVGIASFDVEPAASDQLVFSYAFTSNGDQFDPIAAYRFGLEWVTPVAAVLLSPPDSSSLPSTLDIWPKAGIPDSLVSVDKPNVVVSAFKQAEFGDRNDIILRLQEIAGEPTTVSVQTAIPIIAAYRANAVESPTEELPSVHPLQVSIKPYETVTIRLIPDAVLQRRNEKNIQPR